LSCCRNSTAVTDWPSAAAAGVGVEYSGQPLINPGNNGSIYFGNPGATATKVAFVPPPLQPLTPLNILGHTGYPVRNDNTSSAAYVGSGDGSSPAEQYIAYDPSNPSSSSPIQPGQKAILKNVSWVCCLARVAPEVMHLLQGPLWKAGLASRDKKSTAPGAV
jgi:hypothetical protein